VTDKSVLANSPYQ